MTCGGIEPSVMEVAVRGDSFHWEITPQFSVWLLARRCTLAHDKESVNFLSYLRKTQMRIVVLKYLTNTRGREKRNQYRFMGQFGQETTSMS